MHSDRVRHGERLSLRVRASQSGRDGTGPGWCRRLGLAAIQLAKAGGATVLATASRDKRLRRLAEFGMDHGINSASQDEQYVYLLAQFVLYWQPAPTTTS